MTQEFDVLIVGGGPAGSACARELVGGGLRVAVLDRADFPRLKLCAGWITPEVLAALELAPAEYPHGLLSFDKLMIHVKGICFPVHTVQHSIRRIEFDDFLLRRSGAALIRHAVRDISRRGDGFEVDGRFRGRWLIGAAGTRCPVYRSLFRAAHPRNDGLQVAALEHEFEYQWQDPRCHLWFFDHGLPGYAWYVPKAGGWLNCGLGALAGRLRERGQDLHAHWARFTRMLERRGLVRGATALQAQGYSYFLRGSSCARRDGNALLAGDSAGLATVDLGEGIGPAILSGVAAARTVLDGSDARPRIGATSADQVVQGRLLRTLVRAALARRFKLHEPDRAAA